MSDLELALLPWESGAEFESLRRAFYSERAPQGATERALVDRLVWLEWRRRRLRLAERAAHLASLEDRFNDAARTLARAGVREQAVRERLDLGEVVSSRPQADAALARRHLADRRATARALRRLDSGGPDAYERAIDELHEDTRAWWEQGLAGMYGAERAWEASADGLGAFLREEVTPIDEAEASADAARPAVRKQAFGESFDPVRLERLLVIEARLDRQFEKALSTLLQLQHLRAQAAELGAPIEQGRIGVRG